jgi:hypothetical protein
VRQRRIDGVARVVHGTTRMKATLWSCALTAALLSACSHHDKPAEGPAEKAGAKVDQAGRDTKDAAQDASEKAGEKTEEAGQKIKDKANGD